PQNGVIETREWRVIPFALCIRGLWVCSTQPEERAGDLCKDRAEIFRCHHWCLKLADGVGPKLRAPHGRCELVLTRVGLGGGIQQIESDLDGPVVRSVEI